MGKLSSLKNAIITAALFTFWMHFVVYLIGNILLATVKPLPYYRGEMNLMKLIPKPGETGWYNFVQPLQRFDGLWYKEIALHHYKNNLRSTAFFPLFPFTVEFFMNMSGLSFEQVAFVFNTIFLFAFFVLLYLLAEKDFGKESAWQSVALYAFFPSSFFFLAPYAETLFLVLIMVSLFLVYRKKYFLSSLAGALAAMTKPFGVFFAIPLFYLFYKSHGVRKIKWLRYSYLLFIPLAFLSVVFYQDMMSGVAAATFKSQNYWGIKFIAPWQIIDNIGVTFSKYGYNLPIHINIFLAVLSIILLVASRKIIRFELWLTSFIFLLIFILTSTKLSIIPFFSFSRYFLMFFPFFIFAATTRIKMIYKIFIAAVCAVFFGVMFAVYTVGGFVA